MASTSEKGHAINVANFEDLISYCKSYDKYNPSNETLTIANLEAKWTQGETVLDKLKTKEKIFGNNTNSRMLEYKDLKGLGTRVTNAFSISGANELAVKDIKTINRKLQGTANRLSKKEPPADEANKVIDPVKEISTSQQSYDSLGDHFKKLIEGCVQETSYKPNESDLTIAAIKTKSNALKLVNTGVINSFTDYSNTLAERDEVLYKPKTGLVDIAIQVKNYVKSVYGANSTEFKQVNSINFENIKPKKKKKVK